MKIYILIAAVAAVCGAYLAGVHAGRMKCAVAAVRDAHNTQNEIIQTVGKINVETNRTGTDDIRRVLRRQYTIAE